MTGLAAWEWQALAKIGVGALLMVGSVIGLVIWVVKYQIGSLAQGQRTLFAKFNEGGEVYDLKADVAQLKRLMLHTNPDDTLVARAIMDVKK